MDAIAARLRWNYNFHPQIGFYIRKSAQNIRVGGNLGEKLFAKIRKDSGLILKEAVATGDGIKIAGKQSRQIKKGNKDFTNKRINGIGVEERK